LSAEFDVHDIQCEIEDNTLTVLQEVSTKENLLKILTSLNMILPPIMSYRFQNYVWIKDIRVEINDSVYKFFVSRVRPALCVSSSAKNTEHIISAFKEWRNMPPGAERIIFAQCFFRHALLLSKQTYNTEASLGEILLNLTKCIEVFWGDVRNTIRQKLTDIGFPTEFIEQKIIPFFLLRSKLGIAHVSMAPLTREHKDLMHEFIISAFNNVQYLIHTVSEKVYNEEYQLPPISDEIETEKLRILQSIQEYLNTPNMSPL